MAVTAPARAPRCPEFGEPDQLEALIEEARRRARLRRLRNAAFVVLAASAGTVAVLGLGRGGGGGGAAAPAPLPAAAPWVIKLAGPRLAYVPEFNALSRSVLYVTKPDGSGARVLAACRQSITLCVTKDPVWSPDGRRIAFLRGSPSWPNQAGSMALYVIGLDGRVERRLSDCGGIDGECGAIWGSRPAWSPDGSQIAFTRGGVLSIVDVESARVRALTSCAQERCLDFSPAWSPDQTAIAFTRSTSQDYALFRVSVSGLHPTRLADEGLNPAWAPDGKTILVDTPKGIVSVASDGSQMKLLEPGLPGNGPGVPSWSPDGSRVLYFWTPRERRGYRAEVWTMKPNGAEKKRIYRGRCCIDTWFKPVWSANGKRVALSANHRSLYGVNRGGTFVVDVDGTRLRNLTRLTADIAWQPMQEAMDSRTR